MHHVCLTVTDIDEPSMNWYQQLFQAGRWPGRLPHYAREETGFAEMLVDNSTGLLIGLHHHNANQGEKFEESHTGLDHISFQVADRAAPRPGSTGSTSSTSATPASAVGRTGPTPPWCSATPITTSSNSRPRCRPTRSDRPRPVTA